VTYPLQNANVLMILMAVWLIDYVIGKCQVIQQLSVSVDSDNYSVYVESYLPYLLHTWLESETGPPLEFPWQLIGCESQTACLR